ncbi:arabinan endo-1,5-alpha-L-arabinosidase [Tessaracoccus sp. MC1756]|uniref:arabinan endo-1,5-alpha-L-arabinosidase n=1 Tax=Tessaracoccus sp. MC1756 TaxID=2760311 RepID=UPI0015FF6D77|nr:arabinan endo-1,5-alpha-L-arabinosidase [Tessaracoccus sp. MC1756]MBB1509283.1 arabinan endo-1,5-alpha-L-arabinosidase [Tessaracoccus sp. MC1756]
MGPDYLAVKAVSQADPGLWGAHDPTVVRARDGRWLMMSTDTAVAGSPGAGVQIRQSWDLETWTWFGHAFNGVPGPAFEWSGAHGIWAPEVIRRGEEYRMYYSASSFGSRTSAIALATAPDATGPWEHRALVVSTRHDADDVNAIDAGVTTDADGTDWLLYGSFFGGLRILPLDEAGFPLEPGDLGEPVVHRAASINGAVEGGHIIAARGRYFLVCSFDSLFDTYNVRVAASDSITGPYVDATGAGLIDDSEPPAQVGTLILTSYEAPDGTIWAAPGHSSHLVTSSGLVLVHHVRDGVDPTRHTAHLRALKWTAGGWPVANPLPAPGHDVPEDAVWAGHWLVYRLEASAPIPVRPTRVELNGADLAALATAGRGSVSLAGQVVDAVCFAQDGELAFAGIDEQGVTVWGIKA